MGKHGETLVVDWGLAKATGRTDPGVDAGERALIPSSASGSADTLPSSALGTPAYMSPEQAEGDIEHLGLRSDIYSLGATLYYLLTGRPPQAGDLGEVLRAVQRGEVTPPRRHDATIDPALESVCLKAMAHKPADRYPSPKALAEDIERWMADEPVTAYPEPWTRTLVRWLTRHRTGVTGVAAAVLAGVVGLSAVLAVQTRANAQLSASLTREKSTSAALADANGKLVDAQAKVQARFELAQKAIATFHTGVSEDALLRNDELKALRTSLLKQAAGFYSELRGLIEAQTDAESRRLLADGYFQLGELTAKIGESPEALRVHRQALAVRRELAAAEPTPAARLDVARSLGAVGELLRVTGDGPGSLAAFREQRELAAAVLAESPSDEARDVLAAGHRALGAALWPDAESVPTFQEAVVLWQALADSHPRVTRYGRDLGLSLSRLSGMLDMRGDRAAARAALEQAVRIQQELADAHPADAGLQDDLTHTLNRTALLLGKMGEGSEGVALMERALAIRQRLVRAYPAVSTFQGNLARSHRLLAGSLGHAGRTSEEVDHYEQARVLLKKLAADNPVVTGYRFELAWVHNHLGQLYARLGRFAEAFAALDEGLSLRQKLATSEPGNALYANHVGFSYAYRGKAHCRAGHASEAAADLGRAIGLWEKEKAPNTETRFEQARRGPCWQGWPGTRNPA